MRRTRTRWTNSIMTIFLLVGLGLFAQASTSAQGAPPMAIVGEIPMGRVEHVAKEGNRVLVALGSRVLSVTLDADGSMTQRGFSAPFAAPIRDIALTGTTALVATGGLHIVDVGDPARPFVQASLPIAARHIGFYGDHAIAVGDALHIVDIAQPNAPRIVGTVGAGGSTVAVDEAAKRAYVAAGVDGVLLMDLADVANPSVAGRFTQGYASGVAAADGFAFIADPDEGVRIIDWRDPAAPAEVATVPRPNDACSGSRVCPYAKLVELVENRLFVGYERGVGAFDSRDPAFIQSLDVSDPAAPVEIAHATLRGTPTDMVSWRDGLLVAERPLWWYAGIAPCQMEGGGLLRLDEALEIQDRVAPPIAANALRLEGSRLLMADVSPLRTRAYDVSDPRAPLALERPGWREFGSRYGSAEARDLALIDGQLALAIGGQTTGLLLSISGKAPATSPSSSDPGLSWATDHVAATGSSGALTPSATAAGTVLPAGLLNGCSPPPADQWFERIEALGTDAALLDARGRLRIQATPQNRLGSYEDLAAEDLAIAGDLVHLVGATGYHIVDATDRELPVMRGSLETGGGTIALHGDRAYIGATDGVRVVDVADPRSPSVIGFTATDAEVEDVLVAGSHVYVAAGGSVRALGGADGALAEVARTVAGDPVAVKRLHAAGEHLFTIDGGGVTILALLEGDRVEPQEEPELDAGRIFLPVGER